MPSFSFGDANVSKKKDTMLMLRFFFSKKSAKSFFFPKENIYLRSVRCGYAIHGVTNRWYFGGPGKSWSVKYLPK